MQGNKEEIINSIKIGDTGCVNEQDQQGFTPLMIAGIKLLFRLVCIQDSQLSYILSEHLIKGV